MDKVPFLGSGSSSIAGSGRSMAEFGNPSMYLTTELRSYQAACHGDPELRAFDALHQQRTTHVLSTLALDVVDGDGAMSLDTLQLLTGSLFEMNQEVVNAILESNEDIWKSPELRALAVEFFNNSLRTLEFYNALKSCLHKARDSQLIIHVALRRFADEADGKEKYHRTLEELRQFKAAGNPFTKEFSQVLRSVLEQQVLTFKKLQLRKGKLDKKLQKFKWWRKVSRIIFATTFAAVLICSVVAAVVAAPPVAAALAAAASIPLGSMGKWFDSLLKGYEDAIKGQKEVIDEMWRGTYFAIKDLRGIDVLIHDLKQQIDTLLQSADFSLRDEEAVEIGIEEIRRKLDMFMKSIEDLGKKANLYGRYIMKARVAVLHKISGHPG